MAMVGVGVEPRLDVPPPPPPVVRGGSAGGMSLSVSLSISLSSVTSNEIACTITQMIWTLFKHSHYSFKYR